VIAFTVTPAPLACSRGNLGTVTLCKNKATTHKSRIGLSNTRWRSRSSLTVRGKKRKGKKRGGGQDKKKRKKGKEGGKKGKREKRGGGRKKEKGGGGSRGEEEGGNGGGEDLISIRLDGQECF